MTCLYQQSLGNDTIDCTHPGVLTFAPSPASVCDSCDLQTETPVAPRKCRSPGYPCTHRGEVIDKRQCNVGCSGLRKNVVDVYHCNHPGQAKDSCTIQYRRTDAAACVGCTVREEPAGRSYKWACGVTACPRSIANQQQCYTTLHEAGWDDIIVSAEPQTQSMPYSWLEWHKSQDRQGAMKNFVRLLDLMLRFRPDAEVFHLVQDDTIFARGCREHLDRALWPSPNCGAVSLYTPSHYARFPSQNGWIEITKDRAGAVWGACSLVIPREVAKALARRGKHHGGSKGVDVWVGREVRRLGLSYWCASPSLAQHIGHQSALGHDPAFGQRRASDFVGVAEDVSELGEVGVRLTHRQFAVKPRIKKTRA